MTRATTTRRALVSLVAAGLLLVGCSDPPTPEEERLDRVRTRLESSFSRQQVDCVLEALDDDTIEALAQDAALPADSPALRTYSDALAFCVGRP